MTAIAPEERLIAALAALLLDPLAPPVRHVAVGAASPIPAAACWLVKKSGHDLRLLLLTPLSPRLLMVEKFINVYVQLSALILLVGLPILLGVAGSEAALILVEQKSGGFKISFRSRCQLDCARVAE